MTRSAVPTLELTLPRLRAVVRWAVVAVHIGVVTVVAVLVGRPAAVGLLVGAGVPRVGRVV